jgi:hypothetical protein
MPSDRPRTLEEIAAVVLEYGDARVAADRMVRAAQAMRMPVPLSSAERVQTAFAAILSALREAEARGRAQGDALRAEVEDRRDRWLAAKQGAFMHAETMQLCGTELRLMLERLAPGSREPGAGDAPRIRLHTGVVVTPDELAAMWQGRAAPPTTPAPDMRECATCGDLACLHREDGCHANESAAGCYVKCKRFVPPPPTPTPTEPRACPFCGHAEPRLSCNYCGWRVGRPPHTEHLLPSALARLTDPKTLRRALERGPSPETPAPEAGRPCVECKGRGWHPGDCHPRETCGVCDGSGFAPAAAPPTTPAPRCKACNDTGTVLDESWGVHRIRTCRDCAVPAAPSAEGTATP